MQQRHRLGFLSALGAGAVAAGVIGWTFLGDTDTASAMPARDSQCRLDDLTAQLTEPSSVAGQTEVRVIWVNRSNHACTMNGFGGVDLVNAQGEHLSVIRADRDPSPATPADRTPAQVDLQPGMRAHSMIAYVSAGGTGTFAPTSVLVTPPNETRSAQLPWTSGALPTFEAPSAYELSLSVVRPNVS